MALFPVIGVGASAGGVEAMTALFSHVPRQIPAAFLVVLHIPAHSDSQLDKVLAGATSLPVSVPKDGQSIRPGHVYVATPDRHLMVDGHRIRLTRGPSCRIPRRRGIPACRRARWIT